MGTAGALALSAAKRWRAVGAAAVVAHALGWALPVARDYRGWQAFRVAFTPVWPYEQFRIEPGWLLALSVASALTNALFVALVVWLVLGSRPRLVALAALGALLINLHWPLSMGGQRAALASGYFVWLASFGLLALAAALKPASTRH